MYEHTLYSGSRAAGVSISERTRQASPPRAMLPWAPGPGVAPGICAGDVFSNQTGATKAPADRRTALSAARSAAERLFIR
jgi:hypothetical protein